MKNQSFFHCYINLLLPEHTIQNHNFLNGFFFFLIYPEAKIQDQLIRKLLWKHERDMKLYKKGVFPLVLKENMLKNKKIPHKFYVYFRYTKNTQQYTPKQLTIDVKSTSYKFLVNGESRQLKTKTRGKKRKERMFKERKRTRWSVHLKRQIPVPRGNSKHEPTPVQRVLTCSPLVLMLSIGWVGAKYNPFCSKSCDP